MKFAAPAPKTGGARRTASHPAWRLAISAAAVLACCSMPVAAQEAIPEPPAAMASAAYRDGAALLYAAFDRSVEETVMLTEIPAPPFGEAARAAAFLALLQEAGYADARIDAEGNVLALLPSGTSRGEVVVVSAHLDTVFPEGTDVTVSRDGERLTAPGVGDDTRNLAVLLAYARALKQTGVQTQTDILLVGTVGEEGAGDLRGVRHLMQEGAYAGRVRAFLSFDGLNANRIVAAAVGSRRYRSIFSGPGGHSFGAFGIVNPMGAMARTVEELYALPVPEEPPTTYAASVVAGGTSVNAIPGEIALQIDLRSLDPEQLARLDREYQAGAERAVAQENARRSTARGAVSVEHELIGDRPAGQSTSAAPIAQTALAAYAAHGFTPEFAASSTDSNIPMSLGVPALTVSSGGRAVGAHSLTEYIELPRGEAVRGMQAGYALMLALAEVR